MGHPHQIAATREETPTLCAQPVPPRSSFLRLLMQRTECHLRFWNSVTLSLCVTMLSGFDYLMSARFTESIPTPWHLLSIKMCQKSLHQNYSKPRRGYGTQLRPLVATTHDAALIGSVLTTASLPLQQGELSRDVLEAAATWKSFQSPGWPLPARAASRPRSQPRPPGTGRGFPLPFHKGNTCLQCVTPSHSSFAHCSIQRWSLPEIWKWQGEREDTGSVGLEPPLEDML